MNRPADVRDHAPLGPHTSLKVGGNADYYFSLASAPALQQALLWAREQQVPVHFLGGGSNLLIADEGVEGLVVKLQTGQSRIVEDERGTVLVCDAGVLLGNVARRVSKQGFSGLEWAGTVPGTVGGAVVNNAGAFGGDMAGSLLSATLADAEGTRRCSVDDMVYGYRTSVLKRREKGVTAVLEAELHLRRAANPDLPLQLITHHQEERRRTQPRLLSAGSVFANPIGTYAGKLIEEAGLKGTQEGGAKISDQHANFIVNTRRATARDVYSLVRRVQDAVYARSGIWLQPEIELMGRWDAREYEAFQPRSAPDSPRQLGVVAGGVLT